MFTSLTSIEKAVLGGPEPKEVRQFACAVSRASFLLQ
jgi:hypothetical protein